MVCHSRRCHRNPGGLARNDVATTKQTMGNPDLSNGVKGALFTQGPRRLFGPVCRAEGAGGRRRGALRATGGVVDTGRQGGGQAL